MSVIICAECGSRCNDEWSVCPECGADPHRGFTEEEREAQRHSLETPLQPVPGSQRGPALGALIALGIFSAITLLVTVAGIFSTTYSTHERLGTGFVVAMAPEYLFVAGWAAMSAYLLCLVMRLRKPESEGAWNPPSPAWLVVLGVLACILVALHAVFARELADFVRWGGAWAAAIWLVPVALVLAAAVWAVRVLIAALRTSSPPRRVRPLLWAALANAVAFILVDGLFILVLMYGLAYATSGAD